MNRRFRLAGALCALIALSVSVTESVRASACMPAAEWADAGGAHAAMDHATSPSDDAPRSVPDAPDCPFGPAGAGSSCVGALMPATAAVTMPAANEVAASAAAITSSHVLLLTAGPFHPPRA